MGTGLFLPGVGVNRRLGRVSAFRSRFPRARTPFNDHRYLSCATAGGIRDHHGGARTAPLVAPAASDPRPARADPRPARAGPAGAATMSPFSHDVGGAV